MNMKILILSGCAGIAATISLAQQVELPVFLKNEDLVYKGRVSDMDIYAMKGFSGIWLVTPDGKSAIAGTIFSSIGHDIGAAHTGQKPVRIFEISPEMALMAESVPKPEQIPNSDQKSKHDVEPILGIDPNFTPVNPDLFSEMIMSESELSRSTGQTGQSTGQTGQTGITPTTGIISSILTDRKIMENMASDTVDTISNEDKDVLLQILADMIGNVETEEQLNAVFSDWTDMVTRKYHEEVSGSDMSIVDPVDTVGLVGIVDPVDNVGLVNSVDTVESVGNPVENLADSTENFTETFDETAAELSLADQLLDEIRHDGFWFGIGYPDIPTVYAFMDPACPYCAKAITNIGKEMEQGKIELRVLLVPVVSSGSGDLIASIMTHDNPPLAFMEHEYAHANGSTYLDPGDWNGLPDWMQTRILDNVEIMEKYEIKGVPLFVFDTKDGVRIVPGVAEAGDFATALPDPFKGFIPKEITGVNAQAN